MDSAPDGAPLADRDPETDRVLEGEARAVAAELRDVSRRVCWLRDQFLSGPDGEEVWPLVADSMSGRDPAGAQIAEICDPLLAALAQIRAQIGRPIPAPRIEIAAPVVVFDEALPALVRICREELGDLAVADSVFLCAEDGAWKVVVGRELEPRQRKLLEERIRVVLGVYAMFPGSPVRDLARDPGTDRLLRETTRTYAVDGISVRVLDRDIGSDGIREPARVARPGLRRLVFASPSSATGRSTAVAATALGLTRMGLRVLAIDLDLETPALSDLLVRDPCRLGTIDALLEYGIASGRFGPDGPVPSSKLRVAVPSSLDDALLVASSLGWQADARPVHYAAKISRVARMTDLDFAVQHVVSDLERATEPDVTLVDVRSGMSRMSLAPMLSLGADVLIFDRGDPGSTRQLSRLAAHLDTLGSSVPWSRMHLVHAMARPILSDHARASEEILRQRVRGMPWAPDAFGCQALVVPQDASYAGVRGASAACLFQASLGPFADLIFALHRLILDPARSSG